MTDFVFLNSLINFFNDQPIFVIFVLYLLLYYKDLKPIKLSLENHVTDTNKKIDKLDSRIDKLETELKAGQKALNSKFDKIMDHFKGLSLTTGKG